MVFSIFEHIGVCPACLSGYFQVVSIIKEMDEPLTEAPKVHHEFRHMVAFSIRPLLRIQVADQSCGSSLLVEIWRSMPRLSVLPCIGFPLAWDMLYSKNHHLPHPHPLSICVLTLSRLGTVFGRVCSLGCCISRPKDLCLERMIDWASSSRDFDGACHAFFHASFAWKQKGQIKGIGASSIAKISEFLASGTMEELVKFSFDRWTWFICLGIFISASSSLLRRYTEVVGWLSSRGLKLLGYEMTSPLSFLLSWRLLNYNSTIRSHVFFISGGNAGECCSVNTRPFKSMGRNSPR